MKVKNFVAEFVPARGWRYRAGDNGHTRLYVNESLVWPAESGEPVTALPSRGDKFRLETRDGTLTGTIRTAYTVGGAEVWEISRATWTGEFAGLITGECEIGWFKMKPWPPKAKVYSNIAPSPIPYDDYVMARYLLAAAYGFSTPIPSLWLGPEGDGKLLRSAWERFMALREEAEQIAARPHDD